MLARSGSAVWEIAAAGRPAIFVPYPFATGDHQALNAQHFVRAGGAIMVRELDLDDVPDLVRSLLDDPARLEDGWARRCARGEAGRRGRDRGRARSRWRAMNGRRLWFVGIGGAGLSAYAQLARAWAPRSAAGTRAHAVPRAARRSAHRDRARACRARRVGGGRLVCVPRVPGMRREEFLRELVGARRVDRRRGHARKGTTAAMIAFVLRETGRDPAWLIGAPVPQLGSNAGFGSGYLVVEADESDRTVFALPAEIAVVTNVELDHHSEYARSAELERGSTHGPGRRSRRYVTRRLRR